MDLRYLSLMIFPQQWTGTEIIANLLLLPNGDPTAAVGSELPFSQAQPVLRAAFLPGSNHFPWENPATAGPVTRVSPSYVVPPSPVENSGLPQPPFKSDIFAGLAQQFTPNVPLRAASAGSIKKDLPQTYLAASSTTAPDPSLFSAGDGYGCDLRGTKFDTMPVVPRTMAWGEVLSHALRQPLIAQGMGISYLQIRFPFTAGDVTAGGWLWLEIDTSSPSNWYSQLVTSSVALAADQQPVRSYAARIPALTAAQSMFAAVLFPVWPTVPTATSTVLDPAQAEADAYASGFAQLVHAYQPDIADAIVGNDRTLPPGTDAGFQIGWDDEQITRWMQRQVSTAKAMANPVGGPADEFPLGVQGYRVDAREVPDSSADPTSPTPAWHSLTGVHADVQAGATFSASGNQERTVEPTPVSNGGSANFWLPRYFAHWRTRSLVVEDPYAYAFSGGQPPTPYTQKPTAPQFSGTLTENIDISLRYGTWYQLRTRLADLTGGGPDLATNSTTAGVATLPFLRYVPPKAVSLTLDNRSAPSSIAVARPRLNYPEMVFAGAADDAKLASLLAQLQAAQADGKTVPIFVPDPDVVTLEIIVEALAPAHDTGNKASMQDMNEPPQQGDLDDAYRVVYRHRIPFSSDTVNLTLDPQAVPQIRLITPPAANSTTLPVPTGRDLRIRVRGLGNGDTAYWGSTVAGTGLVTDIQVRYEAASETNILLSAGLALQPTGFFLREDPSAHQQAVTAAGVFASLNSSALAPGLQAALATAFESTVQTPIGNLAQSLDLPLNGMTLSCQPGKRVVFGAQNTIRCSITQDGSAITFSSMKDLIGHWIVVLRVSLNRDWTYRGIAQNGEGQLGIVIKGASSLTNANPTPAMIGQINLPTVVSSLSTQPSGDPAQRDTTEFVFFATVDSTVPPDQFPDVTHTAWNIAATFTNAPSTVVNLWSGSLALPVTANPRQTPKLVSAGIAESPYVADPQYASTEQRQRSLWFELDSPPLDPNDRYFYRILGYGPDPLLMSDPADLPAARESDLPIDPEWIRMIEPGESNDGAGLTAMTELLPATAPLNAGGQSVHYRVPLPESLSDSDLELFGFWTIELRVGHLGRQSGGVFVDLWTTAQARYGRALRVSGVQFPAPPMTVNVDRGVDPHGPTILAVSHYAETVKDGVSLTNPYRPKTQIWFLLYAQVKRTDGQAWRNILLGDTQGFSPQPGVFGTVSPVVSFGEGVQSGQIPVMGTFLQSAVETRLAEWHLPPNTPTSILAVELFGRENTILPPPPGGTPKAFVEGSPLGSNLGSQRILRVSPLTPVRAIC